MLFKGAHNGEEYRSDFSDHNDITVMHVNAFDAYNMNTCMHFLVRFMAFRYVAVAAAVVVVLLPASFHARRGAPGKAARAD